MLSALIPSERSYPAFHLVAKPVHQRFVQPGPLVLGSTSLKYLTPTADRDQPVSRMLILLLPIGMDYTITEHIMLYVLGTDVLPFTK